VNEHDYEPIPGLPAPLPAGEAILWQGSPCWEILARRVLRVWQISAYFAILAVWGVMTGRSTATPTTQIALSALRLGALAVVAVGLLALFAWLVARTTLYTITTRRVVIRFGIALPMTLQIPFLKIDSADLHVWPGGAGDIALSLQAGQRIAYLVLWPHARPWKVARPAPSLRAIPDAASVAEVLGRALADSSSQPTKVVTAMGLAEAEIAPHVSAAA
jgi:Bacterial PH domain